VSGWAAARFSELTHFRGMNRLCFRRMLRKIIDPFQYSFSSDNFNDHFTWRPTCATARKFSVLRQTFNGAENILNKICMYISSVSLRIFETIKQSYSELQNCHAVRTFANLYMLYSSVVFKRHAKSPNSLIVDNNKTKFHIYPLVCLYSCCSHSENMASLKRFVSIQFLNRKAVDRTPWMVDQPVARLLNTQDNTNTE
jgi:hypothetical protein